jgi:hypothetical protein
LGLIINEHIQNNSKKIHERRHACQLKKVIVKTISDKRESFWRREKSDDEGRERERERERERFWWLADFGTNICVGSFYSEPKRLFRVHVKQVGQQV